MSTRPAGPSTAETRYKVQMERRDSHQRSVKPEGTTKGKPPTAASTAPQSQGRRGSGSGVFESQIPKLDASYSKFNPQRRGSNQDDSGVKVKERADAPEKKMLQRRRASDPGPKLGVIDDQKDGKPTGKAQQARRASDLGRLFSTTGGEKVSGKRRDSDGDVFEPDPMYTEIHCTWCQRKGRRTKGHFYCHDCHIGLCERCAKEHVTEVTMNRHSVSVISKTYNVSPNQGPFPNLTQIGSIKLDQEVAVRGSAFLPSGVLLLADFTNSKIRMFTGDYTRKHVASLTLQKEHKWDENRPKPLDIADISNDMFAFTTNTGCIYIVNIGVSMLMKIERIITVIRFESNYGECLGLAYNSGDASLYVGCTSDRDGTYFNIYGVDGVQRRTVRTVVTDVPEYLYFGLDKNKLYAADSDSVTVYDIRDFNMVEQYTELQAQTRDILVDKYGYLYTLALERRTFKSPGSIYRLEPNMGVTKVTALNEKPSSMCYCPKTDTVAVTFNLSRNILLFKLVLRSYEKQYGNEIKPYQKSK